MLISHQPDLHIDDVKTISIVAKKLGLDGRGYISVKNGKRYLVLKGNPGARPVLNGTRYLASNPKVSRIIVGAKSLAKGAARMTGIAVVAYSGLRVVEHILAEDERSLSHLLGTIASDMMKFSAAAAAGWLAAAAVGSLTTLVAGPLIAAVAVGVGVGILLDRMDRKYGLTETMVSAIEDKVENVNSWFNSLSRWIVQWEDHLVQRAINHQLRY